MRCPVAHLHPHPGLLQVLGDQGSQIGLIFNDNDEGLGTGP